METLFFQHKQGSNPFQDEPLPTAHYHPSLQKGLTDTDKQINLSPQRFSKHDVIGKTRVGERVEESQKSTNRSERDFLKGSNVILAKELPTHDTPSPGNTSSKFDESWPASERPSTVESPRDYRPSPSPKSSAKTLGSKKGTGIPSSVMHNVPSSSSTTGSDYLTQWRSRYRHEEQPGTRQQEDGSTLSKYIQRFRYSEPKSRQDRELDKRSSSGQDFWWLAPPSQTSTPTDEGARASARHSSRGGGASGKAGGGRSGIRRGSVGSYGQTTSTISPWEKTDSETEDIQTRAERLLERSESTIVSEPMVSSDGVGLSPISSDYKDSEIHGGVRSLPGAQDSLFIPPSVNPNRQPSQRLAQKPQDDILHQWRIRRRMEEARKKPSLRVGPSPSDGRQTSSEEQHGGSCLEDFRRRLQQQQLLSQAQSSVLTPSQEPPKKTVGTSPIPQTIATQTNGLLPSVGEGAPVRNEPMPGLVTSEDAIREPVKPHLHTLHDINARILINRESHAKGKRELDTCMPAEKLIVASPNVVANPSHHIPPHLHMACDIIPCHLDIRSSISQRTHPARIDGRITDHQHPAQDAYRDSSVALQPDAQHLAPSRDDSSPGDSHSSNLHLQEHSDAFSPESHAAPSHQMQGSKRIPHQHLGSSGIRRREQSPRLDFKEEGDVGGSEEDSGRQPEEMEEGDGEERGRRGIVAYPSSPVGTAVGQVISDRLFGTPRGHMVTSPQSSIDSLPSMHSSLASHKSEVSIAAPVQGQQERETDASDGDEFTDDELLQLLRQRRSRYEHQLQIIEHLLEVSGERR